MGDTIAHLGSKKWVREFVNLCSENLEKGGKLALSFRDYSIELKGNDRFIPVKSDESKILTCFLEYSPEYVKVTDIFYEKINGKWLQSVSSYDKTRILPEEIETLLKQYGFEIVSNEIMSRMIYLTAIKS
ncbi:MAG: hypothetical protein JSS63_12125 [Bacteroidetes bacterium]|nr:hypothetical protein [Bacteroidota bacterium]